MKKSKTIEDRLLIKQILDSRKNGSYADLNDTIKFIRGKITEKQLDRVSHKLKLTKELKEWIKTNNETLKSEIKK